MNSSTWLKSVSQKNVDVEHYAKKCLVDAQFRDWVVQQMVEHSQIMVYYHSYYIVSRASELKPVLFYDYWEIFSELLMHKNSYHRDFGLTILANLIEADREGRFEGIKPLYFDLINDEKFMTAECCVTNLIKIMRASPVYCESVVQHLLKNAENTHHKANQKALLAGKVIAVFEVAYEHSTQQSEIEAFINRHAESTSPKTRQAVKKFKKNRL